MSDDQITDWDSVTLDFGYVHLMGSDQSQENGFSISRMNRMDCCGTKQAYVSEVLYKYQASTLL